MEIQYIWKKKTEMNYNKITINQIATEGLSL